MEFKVIVKIFYTEENFLPQVLDFIVTFLLPNFFIFEINLYFYYIPKHYYPYRFHQIYIKISIVPV